VVAGNDNDFNCEDDRGLVIRKKEQGQWTTGKRLCSIECKSRLSRPGVNRGMHNSRVIAQNAAELLSRVAAVLEEVGFGGVWDD
jgi:hypothetical protein